MYQRESLVSCASPDSSLGPLPGHGLSTRRHDAPASDVAISVEPSAANPVGPDIASTCGGKFVCAPDISGTTVTLDGVREPSENVPSRVTHGSDPLGHRSALTTNWP